MSTWRYTCTRGQGHSLIFVQGHSEWNRFSGEQYMTNGPLGFFFIVVSTWPPLFYLPVQLSGWRDFPMDSSVKGQIICPLTTVTICPATNWRNQCSNCHEIIVQIAIFAFWCSMDIVHSDTSFDNVRSPTTNMTMQFLSIHVKANLKKYLCFLLPTLLKREGSVGR